MKKKAEKSSAGKNSPLFQNSFPLYYQGKIEIFECGKRNFCFHLWNNGEKKGLKC
jgi:hypothetical protein